MDSRLYRFVIASLGKPWELLARGPNSFDCWGFVLAALASVDIQLPDFAYSSEAEGAVAVYSKHNTFAKQVLAPRDGDIVGMGNNKTVDTSHVGIFVSGKVYHCFEKRGVIGNDLDMLTKRVFKNISFWRVYA